MTDTVLVRIFVVIAPLHGLVIKYLKQASLTVYFTAPAIQNHGQASSNLWWGFYWPRHIMVGAQTCEYCSPRETGVTQLLPRNTVI